MSLAGTKLFLDDACGVVIDVLNGGAFGREHRAQLVGILAVQDVWRGTRTTLLALPAAGVPWQPRRRWPRRAP